jgi:hypothetical protein
MAPSHAAPIRTAVSRWSAWRTTLPRAVWFGIVGIGCMGLVQAMTFSFLERVGSDHGFGLAHVTGVLVALGVAVLCFRRLPLQAPDALLTTTPTAPAQS